MFLQKPIRSKSLKAKSKEILLYISLVICVIILADTYFSPLEKKMEFIKELEHYSSYSKFGRSGDKSLVVKTIVDRYIVPRALYDDVEQNDSLCIYKSKITGSIQKFDLKRQGKIITFQGGFIRSQLGLFMTFATILAIISFLLFSNKIKEEYTRRNLFIFLVLLPYALILFHLDVNLFLNN